MTKQKVDCYLEISADKCIERELAAGWLVKCIVPIRGGLLVVYERYEEPEYAA